MVQALRSKFIAIALMCMLLLVASPAHAGKDFIFLMIGDGMGLEHIGLMESYNSHVYDKKSAITALMKDAHIAVVKTGSANSPVTDSAAAATAMSTGMKTNNDMVNVLPDGKSLEPLFVKAKKAGYKTALITTDSVVGGSPAGFAAVAKSRKEYDAIAEMYLKNDVDYIIGGGRMYFVPEKEDKGKKKPGRKDGKDLLAEAKNKGYTVVTKLDEFEKLEKASKLVALFADKEIDFANADRDPTVQPSLKEMTDKFLELAKKEGKPFLVMIEGARIDHASHNNDVAAVLEEMRDFDDAVASVVDFYNANKANTAVVVTSDHATGGLAMTCYKDKDKTLCPTYDSLHAMKKVPFSHTKIIKTLDSTYKGIKAGNPNMSDEEAFLKATQQMAEEHTVDLHLTPEEAKLLRLKQPIGLAYTYKAQETVYGKAYFPMLFTTWATAFHTHSPVLSISVGKGTEALKGYIDNTDIAKTLLKLIQ